MKSVFEEIAETIEEDRLRDEEFTLKLRSLVKEYYPFNIGHEISITWPKGMKRKFI
jgi:hypothetical protein